MISALALAVALAQTPPAKAPVDTSTTPQTLPAMPVLTLQQAIAEAKEKNLDLQIARARLSQARTTAAKVWSAYLPQLSVGASYTRNNTAAKITLPTGYIVRDIGTPSGPPFDPTRDPSMDNPPGGPTNLIAVPDPKSLIEADIQTLDQFGAQAQFSQAIIAPQLWPAIRNAYVIEDIASLNVENARRDILFGVAQVYFGAAGLRQAVAVQERQLALNRDHEKDAKVKYEAGALPKVALIRAEIDRARSEQDLKRAQNNYASAKSSLATLLAREPDFDVEVPAEANIPTEDRAKLEEKMSDRPDLLAAQKNLELAGGQRTQAWLKYLPNIGVSGVYRYANVTGFTGTNDTWAVTLGLNWQIFDGGLREAEIREASAKVAEARANQRNLEVKAKDELTRALLDLDSARANAKKAEEQRALARENMRLVQVGYDAGSATYIELTDANTALLSAEIGFVAENLNARLAAVRVLKAAGVFAAEAD